MTSRCRSNGSRPSWTAWRSGGPARSRHPPLHLRPLRRRQPHYNLSRPAGAGPDWATRHGKAVTAEVIDEVVRYGGSISAEHGIGQLKRDDFLRTKDPLELRLMSEIKRVSTLRHHEPASCLIAAAPHRCKQSAGRSTGALSYVHPLPGIRSREVAATPAPPAATSDPGSDWVLRERGAAGSTASAPASRARGWHRRSATACRPSPVNTITTLRPCTRACITVHWPASEMKPVFCRPISQLPPRTGDSC